MWEDLELMQHYLLVPRPLLAVVNSVARPSSSTLIMLHGSFNTQHDINLSQFVEGQKLAKHCASKKANDYASN